MTTRCAKAVRQAEANGWFVVSDTSWAGYTEVPRLIMQGYRVMADEVADQWSGDPPTHVFIQGGVGGGRGGGVRADTGAVSAGADADCGRAGPRACLLASAELGEPTRSRATSTR